MLRFLVTGTDTGVGKTRVAAALARALLDAGESPTIVKLVQTGIDGASAGDACRAGGLAQTPFVEIARFHKAADPWSAALAEGLPPVHAEDLVREVDAIGGAVVAEGAAGLAVPLNGAENFATVARLARMAVVLAVGLRLGCMNRALLTVALCEQLRLRLAGAVFIDRWNRCAPDYEAQVRRILNGRVRVLGTLPFEPNEQAAVEEAAHVFVPLTKER